MQIQRYLAAGLLVLAFGVSQLARASEKGEADELVVKLVDCPAAVQATLQTHAAGGTIVKVEKTTEDGAVCYEAKVQPAKGPRQEIVVAPDGTLKKVQTDDEEDEKGETEKKK